MTTLINTKLYFKSVSNAPKYIAPRDVIQEGTVLSGINLSTYNATGEIIAKGKLEIGFCKSDGSNRCKLYVYDTMFYSSKGVNIFPYGTINAVPTYAAGQGDYCIYAAYTSNKLDDTEYIALSGVVGIALDERKNPTATYSFSDAKGFYDTFSAYVLKYSSVSFTCTATADTRDPTTQIKSIRVTLGDTSTTLESGSAISLGTISSSDNAGWRITVTDTKGKTFTETGTLNCISYTKPKISSLSIERYKEEYNEQGVLVPVKNEEAETVWLNAKFSVDAINGMNQWEMKTAWTGHNDLLYSGTGGVSRQVEHDVNAIPYTFAASSEWTFKFTLKDKVTSTSITFILPKAGAIFNIESTGVSVGMRSTGTEETPLFEVAYQSKHYADIYDKNNVVITGVNYDTTNEILIGAYNGKALYRRCIELSSVSTSSAATAANVKMGITPKEIININGFVFSKELGDLPINAYGSSSRMACCIPLRADGQLTGVLQTWAGATNSGARIFVEYTKD